MNRQGSLEASLEATVLASPSLDEPPHVTAPPGTELAVEIEGVYGLLKSELVGQREGRYLIIRSPLAPPGVATKLFKGNKLIARYTEGGFACGFQSTILAHITDPEPLLFLAPPALLQEKSMRASRRVDAHIPCVAAVHEKTTPGTIVDISVEGCRCILPTHLPSGLLHLHMGDAIIIEVQFGTQPTRLPGKVRSVNMLQTSAHVGIHFQKLAEEAEQRVIQFMIAQGVQV